MVRHITTNITSKFMYDNLDEINNNIHTIPILNAKLAYLLYSRELFPASVMAVKDIDIVEISKHTNDSVNIKCKVNIDHKILPTENINYVPEGYVAANAIYINNLLHIAIDEFKLIYDTISGKGDLTNDNE